jgi:hypothetical protein
MAWNVPAFIVALALAQSACAPIHHRPWMLKADRRAMSVPVNARAINSYTGAVAAITEVLHRDLRLDLPPVTLVFVPDHRMFAAILVRTGITRTTALDVAHIAMAMGGRRAVLVNEQELGRERWPRRVSLLAHELTHVLEYELGGGTRGTSAQWLREGFADWMAARVLDSLQIGRLSDSTDFALMRFVSRGPRLAGRP